MNEKILVTGGCGYIGSHTCVELLRAGYELVVVDNLSNSRIEALRRVEKITGKHVPLVVADLNDRDALQEIFRNYPVYAVIHFAGLKAVGESVLKPLYYYHNNVCGSIVLFETMAEFGVKRLVFSSSATVWRSAYRADTGAFPIHMVVAMIENWCMTLSDRHGTFFTISTRWAHERPDRREPRHSNTDALFRCRESAKAAGVPTSHDGTGCATTFVWVLAAGHLAALKELDGHGGTLTVNLGTGQGYSVLDMVQAFEKVSGRPIPYRIVERRPGDIASCYADPALACELMGWRAARDLDTMCRDAWRWQSMNPNGYGEL